MDRQTVIPIPQGARPMRAFDPSCLLPDRLVIPNHVAPPQILCGPMLCRLHVWTEAEWTALAEDERPAQYVHAPGLGWVGAVPQRCMN